MDGEEQEGHDGEYGFGSVRTLKEYEEYSGLHFGKRGIQQYTLDKHIHQILELITMVMKNHG